MRTEDPGEFRHAIDICRNQTTTSNNFGGRKVAPVVVYGGVRAKIMTTSAKETRETARANEKQTLTFRLRYMGGIDHAMVIGYDGAYYNIVSSINVQGRDKYLDVTGVSAND